jgi:hypothetical protein
MATQSVKFPQQNSNLSASRALKKWIKQQPVPKGAKIVARRVKAVALTKAALEQLRSIVGDDEGDVPPSRPRGSKEANTQKVLGTVYSVLATYEYMLMRNEYRDRLAKAGLSPLAQAVVRQQWRRIVTAAQQAFKAGGLAVTEVGLNTYVSQLQSGTYLNAVIKIRQSAVAAGLSGHLTSNIPVLAAIVPTVGAIAEAIPTASVIPNLCSTPIKQGSFTKHFGGSVALRVRVTNWCPTWKDWDRTCTKIVTVATASYSLNINVGYKITCCGATAWGKGVAQACAGVFGYSLCAGCTGLIVGVAGVSRTPVGSGCQYGLGIKAALKCSLAGINLLDLSYTFGWVVSGPCPDPLIPCP